jgi:hypothetical protein
MRKNAENATLLWWRDHVLHLTVPVAGGDVLYLRHLNSLVNCVPLTLHGFSTLVKFKSSLECLPRVPRTSRMLRVLRTPRMSYDHLFSSTSKMLLFLSFFVRAFTDMWPNFTK